MNKPQIQKGMPGATWVLDPQKQARAANFQLPTLVPNEQQRAIPNNPENWDSQFLEQRQAMGPRRNVYGDGFTMGPPLAAGEGRPTPPALSLLSRQHWMLNEQLDAASALDPRRKLPLSYGQSPVMEPLNPQVADRSMSATIGISGYEGMPLNQEAPVAAAMADLRSPVAPSATVPWPAGREFEPGFAPYQSVHGDPAAATFPRAQARVNASGGAPMRAPR